MSCASSRNISGETTLFSNLSYFVSRLPGPDGYEDCLCSRKTPLHQKNEIISLYGWALLQAHLPLLHLPHNPAAQLLLQGGSKTNMSCQEAILQDC